MHPAVLQLADGSRRIFGSQRWKVTPAGVIVGKELMRTQGPPETMRRLVGTFGTEARVASIKSGVPLALILACAATESGGRPDSVRLEPGYISDEVTPGRVSAGLMQTLISTARNMASLYGFVAKGGVTREWLLDPANSLLAGAMYLAFQKEHTGFDPVLALAAYNAGGVYENKSPQNHWKLRQYPINSSAHVDRGVRWYGDALAVLAEAKQVGHAQESPQPAAQET